MTTLATDATIGAPVSSRLAGLVRSPWWSLAIAAIAAGVGVWLLAEVADDEALGGLTARAVLVVVVGWSFIGSGLIALRRSVEPRIGLMMAASGFALIVGPLFQYAPWSLVVTVGVWLANAWVVLFVWFLVSFPGGRLRSRGDALLLAPFLLALGPLMLLWFLF